MSERDDEFRLSMNARMFHLQFQFVVSLCFNIEVLMKHDKVMFMHIIEYQNKNSNLFCICDVS